MLIKKQILKLIVLILGMVSLEDIRLTLKKIKDRSSTHFMCLRVFVSSQNILISITPLYVKINF